MTESRPLLVVTGASGYIGNRLCAAALDAGWDVLALARRRPPGFGAGFAPYDLANPRRIDIPAGAAAIVHLASDTQSAEPDMQRELAALRALCEASLKSGARLVLVSSQAAAPDAPTGYGRVKWNLEQAALSARAVVVRPGMVYGGPEAGLFGRLCAIVRRQPFVPAPWPPPSIQLIHVDDLASALLRVADPSAMRSGVFEIADPQPVSFTGYLRAIARHRVRRFRCLVPVPTAIVLPLIGVASRLFKRAPIDPRRLLSLLNLRRMQTERDNAALGVVPRPLAEGLAWYGRRRGLIREGRTLLAYFLGAAPQRALNARYVRAVERIDGGEALQFRAALHACPALCMLVEGPRLARAPDASLQRRIDIAFQLSEASRAASRFILDRPMALPRAAVSLAGSAALELTARVVRPFAGPLLYAGRDGGAERP